MSLAASTLRRHRRVADRFLTPDSELVCYYGVVAPGTSGTTTRLDTAGKTLIMLVDDPPANAAEPDLFKGKVRTYYGRWTQVRDGAAKRARGVILTITNEAAGYPWKSSATPGG